MNLSELLGCLLLCIDFMYSAFKICHKMTKLILSHTLSLSLSHSLFLNNSTIKNSLAILIYWTTIIYWLYRWHKICPINVYISFVLIITWQSTTILHTYEYIYICICMIYFDFYCLDSFIDEYSISREWFCFWNDGGDGGGSGGVRQTNWIWWKVQSLIEYEWVHIWFGCQQSTTFYERIIRRSIKQMNACRIMEYIYIHIYWFILRDCQSLKALKGKRKIIADSFLVICCKHNNYEKKVKINKLRILLSRQLMRRTKKKNKIN